MREPRLQQVRRDARIRGERGHVEAEGRQREVVDAILCDVEHARAAAQQVQPADQPPARLPVARHQDERLVEAAHAPGEAALRQGASEARVLQQGQQRADRPRPARRP